MTLETKAQLLEKVNQLTDNHRWKWLSKSLLKIHFTVPPWSANTSILLSRWLSILRTLSGNAITRVSTTKRLSFPDQGCNIGTDCLAASLEVILIERTMKEDVEAIVSSNIKRKAVELNTNDKSVAPLSLSHSFIRCSPSHSILYFTTPPPSFLSK